MRNFVRHLAGVLGALWLSWAGADPAASPSAPPADAGVRYGPHGGVVGLPPGSYVCIVNDERANGCLVRAIAEAEIVRARDGGDEEYGPPAWMQTALGSAQTEALAAVGLPLDNEFGLPGLMTPELSADQQALVQCLAHTRLGRRLEQWSDPAVYQRGIVDRCTDEVRGLGAGEAAALPLPARFIQEAAVIDVGTHRLADANRLYSAYAGRFARSTSELSTGAVLAGAPAATPSMRAGFALAGGNTIVVELKPGAGDVCRALNLIHGRTWASIPDSLPPGARAGCYPTPKGYRFEDQQ